MTRTFKRLSFLALAILAWGVAGPIGGSGFIAAFVGGFATERQSAMLRRRPLTFSEAEGELLLLVVSSLSALSQLRCWNP